MVDQIDLFPPYQKHSETGFAAALEIKAPSGTLRRLVYGFIHQSDSHGATDEEIQTGLRMNPSTQRPRRVELVERGLVIDSGKKRLTNSGRQAVVWRVPNDR